MATFAKIGLNGEVIKVLSVANEVLKDSNGIEQEQLGIEFLKNLFNEPNAVWKQTSYNTVGGIHQSGGIPFRKNPAGKGYIYDSQRDAFIPPKPFNSWILNENTCTWESPISCPETYIKNKVNISGTPIRDSYNWNEQTLSWDLLDNN